MFKNFKVNDTDSFLKSLDYWRTINLYITLLQAQTNMSYDEARFEALKNYDNQDKLKYMLEEAINSPVLRK
ncbi:hypothetical protein [Limosilactobacillus ingluviei]|uniref:hypothetical protein n=1 Tax=Limosilactobacillus ingluviei TaxID=148604 RepID=UPI0024BBC0ED|nr:hypothetical protein [Limosilactobacillus ingluviei]